jgi:hypothetical protein
LDEIKSIVIKHGVYKIYDFSTTVHCQGIEATKGWKTIIDRGMDIFKKHDYKYELGSVDPTKRKCERQKLCVWESDNHSLSSVRNIPPW